ncbi:MAG: hypothetical protein D6725_13830 [Planctomycetota bacterium]|nr:MAG: hypothetical protein D6725_13830 [Planctomycetota bacterium]
MAKSRADRSWKYRLCSLGTSRNPAGGVFRGCRSGVVCVGPGRSTQSVRFLGWDTGGRKYDEDVRSGCRRPQIEVKVRMPSSAERGMAEGQGVTRRIPGRTRFVTVAFRVRECRVREVRR